MNDTASTQVALGMSGEGDWEPGTEARQATSPLNGVWLSKYQYESSGRGATFSNAHYLLLVQHGDKIQGRALPGTTDGRLLMDLTVNGSVITGVWTEETSPTGYYRGATYHGAIQMLLEPSGRKMAGKWVGFGKDFDLNTGAWTLELVTSDTGPDSQAKYNRPVGDRTPHGDMKDD